jgi:hypothetical protein
MAKYFIAYAYFIPHGPHGFGNIEADRSWPISSTEDITDLTEHITEAVRQKMKQPRLTIAIISWQQFEPDIERYRPDGPPPNNIISLPSKT